MEEDQQIFKLLDDYRRATFLEDRLEAATKIYKAIQADIKLYILGRIPPSEANDVLSETFKAIFTGLQGCRAKNKKQFFKWCYQIASYKIADYIRKKKANDQRFEPLLTEEVDKLVQESTERTPPAPGEMLDLRDAMDVLAKAKPMCRDLLWKHFLDEWDVAEIAKELKLKYAATIRRIERCLTLARKLAKN